MCIIRKIIRKEDGSITLEAAMIMPFFMLFIVFLATLIRISIADMALYKAASETSEVIVAFAYPVDIAKSSVEEIMKDKIQSVLGEDEDDIQLEEATKWARDGLEFFGIDVDASIEGFIEGLVGNSGILEPGMREKFKTATGGSGFFDPSKLSVTNVELPSLAYGSGDYLQIDVEYELDISFPFVNKTIVLQKTSYERLWNGS